MGIGDWGLGIGDWGLGIGDWAQSPIPNPHLNLLIFKILIIKIIANNKLLFNYLIKFKNKIYIFLYFKFCFLLILIIVIMNFILL